MTAETPLGRTGFTPKQSVILIGFGIILWLTAAIVLLHTAPMGAYDGLGRIAVYGLVIPATYVAYLLARAVSKFRTDQYALAGALMVAVATLCDGIALAYFPGLYGGTDAYVAGAGAAILWGVGVALTMGFVLNRSPD